METYDKLAKYYFERRKNRNRFDYNRDIDVPALIKMIGNVKHKTILDIGCGFGDHAEKLSKQNYSYQENSFISIKKSDIKWYAISILTAGMVIGWIIGTAILLFILLK